MTTLTAPRPRTDGPRPAPAPRRRSRDTRRKHIAAYAFLLPFLIVFVAMLVVPLFYAGYLSLFREQLVGGSAFVGLENYVQALQDQRFLEGVGRMALFLVVQVPVMLILALAFALALDSGRVRGGKFARLAIFVPYAVPGVVTTLMWGYLYGRNFGPIAQVFEWMGLDAPDLLSSGTILGSIMNIVTWQYIGYNMVIMYSALRAIPGDLYEAARIDGAGQFRIAWSIKIPAIRSAIMLTVIFSIIGSFQLFSEPKLLYEIAPNAIGTSFSPNLYAYNLAFVNQDVNYAAAIAFLLGFVIMIVSYAVQLGTARREKKGAAR
ncbi:carbohydrate ABC transporter permease [Microbacterium indicum]|uniref:carbohydrate ABC transporter permease n=1 Tax=Microbacterium indicum TaxID=358100 RepID=UPI000404933B|nr:sugar ABC transporter permease [Microbacterium indicum]